MKFLQKILHGPFALAILVLITPFVVFLNHNDYGYLHPEIILALAGLIALGLLSGLIIVVGNAAVRVLIISGLLTLFIDFQFNWFNYSNRLIVAIVFGCLVLLSWALRDRLNRILTVFFATILLVTLLLPPGVFEQTVVYKRNPNTSPLPRFVHLILDAHIAPEGIPHIIKGGLKTKEQIKSFYHSYGFHLYGRAYSVHFSSLNSISNILNLAVSDVDRHYVEPDSDHPYLLKSNEYFKHLYNMGYNIHVYQVVDFMDYCKGFEAYTARCNTRSITSIAWVKTQTFPTLDKLDIVSRSYMLRSYLLAMVRSKYLGFRKILQKWDLNIPMWAEFEKGINPDALFSLDMFNSITADVLTSSPGDMFFAHLIIPHTPFALDSECNLIEPREKWGQRASFSMVPRNTPTSRAERYTMYLDQLQCAYKKLDEMFTKWQDAGIFQDMIVILHGDHGSKIYIHKPHVKNRENLTKHDYVDAFSTLLAVKWPGNDARYDLRFESVQKLLTEIVLNWELKDDNGAANNTPGYVFLPGRNPMLRSEFQSFGVDP